MVVVDAYSKWLEVALMPSTTTEAVIRVLRGLFATHGCPDVLVLDNGPQFTLGTFERSLLGLGIHHALMAAFHPASNGQTERMVCSAKEALVRLEQRDWHERVTEYLLVQHITPHVATGRSPTELLMGFRSPLDQLHPDFGMAEPLGCTNMPWSFIPGNQVFAWNFVGDIPWVPAMVVGVTGPCSYQVALQNGHLWRRHIDQLRHRVGDLDITTVPPTVASAPERLLMEGEAPPTSSSQTEGMEPSRAILVGLPGSPEIRTTAVPDRPPSLLVAVPSTAAEPGNSGSMPHLVAPQSQPESGGHPYSGTGPWWSDRVSKRPAYLKDYVQLHM
uniref:uncharacterized protein K02A2.6-like n=1 Tax=Podarcis muralis TaxID=64176 RepID=UPI00109FF432|nr:uncharacterized protein K02A2.6-like [Podarcis muralis]